MPKVSWDEMYETAKAQGAVGLHPAVAMLPAEEYEPLLWDWWADHGWTLDRVMRMSLSEAEKAMAAVLEEHRPMLGGMAIDRGPVGLRYGPPGSLVKNRREIRSHSIIHRAYETRWEEETKDLPKHKPGKPLPEDAARTLRDHLLAAYVAESARRPEGTPQAWAYYGNSTFNRWAAMELRRVADQDVIRIYEPDYRTFVVIEERVYTGTAIRKFLEGGV